MASVIMWHLTSLLSYIFIFCIITNALQIILLAEILVENVPWDWRSKNNRITYVRYVDLYFSCTIICQIGVCLQFLPHCSYNTINCRIYAAPTRTLRPYVFTRPRVKIQGKKYVWHAFNIITRTKPPFERSNRASTCTVLVPCYKLFAAICKMAMRNEQSCHTTLEW